jgi:hypothetical protein
VTRNLTLIADQARAIGLFPELRFDIVITDKTIFQIERTVQFGLGLGVTDFYFADLYKLPDVKGDFNVYNVSSMAESQLLQALKALESAERIVRDAGCKISVHPGLVESILLRLNFP